MRFKKTAAVVGAFAAVVIAGPAFAGGPPYTVTAGGHTSGDWAFSAHSSSIVFTVHNSGGDRVMTCNDVTVSGVVHAGTSINPVADITSSTWNGCFFGTSSVTVAPDHSPAWQLVGSTPATTGNSDTIDGQVTPAVATVTTLGGACSFPVSGAADASFIEATQTVSVNETSGHLRLGTPTFGCFGQVANNDAADFVGDFAIDSGSAAYPVYLS